MIQNGELAPFDMLSEQLQVDPYPVYDQYRRLDPVHLGIAPFSKSRRREWWYVFSYAVAEKVLADSNTFSSNLSRPIRRGESVADPGAFWRNYMRWMKVSDPPEHTTQRRMVSHLFRQRCIDSSLSKITTVASSLIDRLEKKYEIELVSDFSKPFSTVVMLDTLGIPVEDAERIDEWLKIFSATLEYKQWEDLDGINRAATEFEEYLSRFLAQTKCTERRGVIDHMLSLREQGVSLDVSDFSVMCLQLLLAGHEATSIAISSCLFNLLDNPEQLALVRGRPELAKQAINETVRYHTPIQVVSRVAIKDSMVGDKFVREGEPVTLMLGACNRDSDIYQHPEKFDINRKVRNLAFGGGIHYCIGRRLGETMGAKAVSVLLERLPDLRCSGKKVEWSGPSLRGIKTLHLLRD